MASLELCSQYDYAKKALALYRKNEKSQNPFLLSLGVNAIEMLLKSIIEQESGIIPEELDTHYLLEICTEINKMRIPHFQINYKFQQMCKEIQRYYNGARYYNPNNRRSNIFDDFDYKIVKETVDATEELLKEYEQIHIKNLEDLAKDL